MNASTAADALLIGAAVVWVLARQVRLGPGQAAAVVARPAGPCLLRDPRPAHLDLACTRRSRPARPQSGCLSGAGRMARPDYPGLA
jgi:hypothetical protein